MDTYIPFIQANSFFLLFLLALILTVYFTLPSPDFTLCLLQMGSGDSLLAGSI